MDTKTGTLAEFLLARIAEDEAARMAYWTEGNPDPALEAAMRETALWKFTEFNLAVRRLGANLPLVRRVMVSQYADHPDYRDEWD